MIFQVSGLQRQMNAVRMAALAAMLLMLFTRYQYHCCEGWTNYIAGRGCVSAIPCTVELPQHSISRCKKSRKLEVTKLKAFFKLTSPSKNADKSRVLQIPLLDQPVNIIYQYYALDTFSAHWSNSFQAVNSVVDKKITPAVKLLFGRKFFNTTHDYVSIFKFFKMQLSRALKTPYYKFTSSYKYATDIILNGKWESDKFFTQQRLAGTCPTSIRRVTFSRKIGTSWVNLKKRLNTTFDFAKEIKKVTGKGLGWSIKSRLVYVEEYPLFCQIEFTGDAMAKYHFGPGVMRNDTCPIAIYAVHKSPKGQRELRIVAIQMDSVKTSVVYTPKDGLNWKLAKSQIQVAAFIMSQVKDHLLKVHYQITPICVSLKRHLSALHPLQEILKFHCRGTIPASAFAITLINNKNGYFHLAHSIGSKGVHKLINKAFEQMKWNDIDIYSDTYKRGLQDRRVLPYFPYRDDGMVISNVLSKFSRDFVNLHYRGNKDVVNDYELQNLINQLSIDGKRPPDNGKGKVKGLPSKFTTKQQVKKFLKSILWISVFHSAINYPTSDFGTMPNLPGKLYNDPRAALKNNFNYMLPGAAATILQTAFISKVTYLYYDKLFDYSKQLDHSGSSELVLKYYQLLMDVVRPLLDKRNKRRQARGQLAYPYFVPGWITNSPSS